MADRCFALGIDVGTTKVAAAASDRDGNQLAWASVDHRADSPAPPGHALQAPDRLLAAVREAIGRLPARLRAGLGAVGLTGQMHGVLLVDRDGEPIGDLVTWQDQRCAREPRFLEQLVELTGRRLRTGYGCATLAWIVRHGGLPARAAAAATIHDWLAARLCGLAMPVTDPTDAASLGLFDLKGLDWDLEAVRAAGIPAGLLPRIVASGSAIGLTSATAARELGIPAGIPVAAPVGDNPASHVALLARPDRQALLALGTGGQLSVVAPRGELARWALDGVPWECRPYLGNELLVVAASLSAGSAWRWLAEAAASWARDLGAGDVPLETVYARMNELGAATGPIAGDERTNDRGPEARAEPVVSPHFLGERFDPSLRGSIEGIGLDNFTLGSLARALARGIVRSLREMLPEAALAGRERLVGSGNALRRNPLLKQMAEDVLELPLELPDLREEAAHGAARLAARLLDARTPREGATNE